MTLQEKIAKRIQYLKQAIRGRGLVLRSGENLEAKYNDPNVRNTLLTNQARDTAELENLERSQA